MIDSPTIAMVVAFGWTASLCVACWAIFRGLFTRVDGSHPFCTSCGYDLVGSPSPLDSCPECGRVLQAKSSVRFGRYIVDAHRVGLGVGMLLVVLVPALLVVVRSYSSGGAPQQQVQTGVIVGPPAPGTNTAGGVRIATPQAMGRNATPGQGSSRSAVAPTSTSGLAQAATAPTRSMSAEESGERFASHSGAGNTHPEKARGEMRSVVATDQRPDRDMKSTLMRDDFAARILGDGATRPFDINRSTDLNAGGMLPSTRALLGDRVRGAGSRSVSSGETFAWPGDSIVGRVYRSSGLGVSLPLYRDTSSSAVSSEAARRALSGDTTSEGAIGSLPIGAPVRVTPIGSPIR